MKHFSKLTYLLLTFLILFSCDNQTDEISTEPVVDQELSRSFEEITALIQADPWTEIHMNRINNIVKTGDFKLSSSKSGAAGPIPVSTKEETMAYYNGMIEKYPELKELPVPEQLEVIYGVKMEDFDTQAKTYEASYGRSAEMAVSDAPALTDVGGSGDTSHCTPILGLAVAALNFQVILLEFGFTDLADTMGGVADLMIGFYNLCIQLSN